MLVPSVGATINWSGAIGIYHIYRSQNGSGAGNGASNGRYDYLATVTTTEATGSYIDSSPGAENWYIVVPADSGGAINGCHSEEGPLAVTLAIFTAISQEDHVLINWKTVAELNNLGFNLLRSTSSADGEQTKLNDELIPSQAPGSGQGASYSFEDDDVEDDTTYYYWLEDVDTSGRTRQYGPQSVTYQSDAMAVEVATLRAVENGGQPWAIGALASLLLAVGGYVWYRRARQ
jgi:hypothetical protein